MKKIFIIIISLSFSLNMYSQVKYTVTDSAFVKNTKFLLIETEDGVAEIKAFYKGGGEAPISGVIKMPPPVYFLKENGTNKLRQDDFISNNEHGDIATVFVIVGNEASVPDREYMGIKSKEDVFCGINIQGIITYPGKIELTEFIRRGFTCVERNYMPMHDLRYFVHKHFNMKKKRKQKRKRKKQRKNKYILKLNTNYHQIIPKFVK